MKAYYCISNRDREFLYVPFVLFSYCSQNSSCLTSIWDKDILSKLTLLVKEGKLTKSKLEDRGWDLQEIDIPDRILTKFTDACFRGKKNQKLLSKASRIFDWVQDYMEYREEIENCWDLEESKPYRDSYDGIDDEEDYRDDWWKRGEDFTLDL